MTNEELRAQYRRAANRLSSLHGISSELGRRRGLEATYRDLGTLMINRGFIPRLKRKYRYA